MIRKKNPIPMINLNLKSLKRRLMIRKNLTQTPSPQKRSQKIRKRMKKLILKLIKIVMTTRIPRTKYLIKKRRTKTQIRKRRSLKMEKRIIRNLVIIRRSPRRSQMTTRRIPKKSQVVTRRILKRSQIATSRQKINLRPSLKTKVPRNLKMMEVKRTILRKIKSKSFKTQLINLSN